MREVLAAMRVARQRRRRCFDADSKPLPRASTTAQPPPRRRAAAASAPRAHTSFIARAASRCTASVSKRSNTLARPPPLGEDTMAVSQRTRSACRGDGDDAAAIAAAPFHAMPRSKSRCARRCLPLPIHPHALLRWPADIAREDDDTRVEPVWAFHLPYASPACRRPGICRLMSIRCRLHANICPCLFLHLSALFCHVDCVWSWPSDKAI